MTQMTSSGRIGKNEGFVTSGAKMSFFSSFWMVTVKKEKEGNNN